METGKLWADFYRTVLQDAHIGTAHISVYAALYYLWLKNGHTQPVFIKRAEVMELAKISSSATYHKVIKHLRDYGYIGYYPCCHPGRNSEVYLTCSNVGMNERS